MTLQILDGPAWCGDDNSRPEYYATASRRDPAIEEQIDEINGELENLEFRIKAFDERIEPLRLRQYNTVPLSVDEQRELERLRARQLEILRQSEEIARLLEESRGEERGRMREDRSSLESEREEIERSLRRLENSIPLSDEEARVLLEQLDQRAPLAERRSQLIQRKGVLNDILTMRTPGSLRVYSNDSLRLRLMEDDFFADDTCASWQLRLDTDIIERGWIDLESGNQPLLRLNVREISP